MKILFIHNNYSKHSGEEHASGELSSLLTEHGHTVEWYRKTSSDIIGFWSKLKAFFAGIYNPQSAKELSKVLDEYKPDIVQVQNLYPFISTSIFKPIKERNIPIVMRCPNYRLFCPNGLCLNSKGKVCEKCWGKGHEWWCIKNNCENNIAKSIGYALRNCFARISGNIIKGVDVFIVQSDFQKSKFIEQGIQNYKIGILPGISPIVPSNICFELGEWASFVGRVSEEKGIYEFIECAKLNPNIPFKVAGSIDECFVMPDKLPLNLDFMGFLNNDKLNDFYAKSRIIVVPSKWYEGFPNVILRGMLFKKPIITTNIGAMQSIIEDGKDGLLISPGCVNELSEAVSNLYYDSNKCINMGNYGFEKATNSYSRENIYNKLITIYKQAILNNQNKE